MYATPEVTCKSTDFSSTGMVKSTVPATAGASAALARFTTHCHKSQAKCGNNIAMPGPGTTFTIAYALTTFG
jgi:hypothetical protein